MATDFLDASRTVAALKPDQAAYSGANRLLIPIERNYVLSAGAVGIAKAGAGVAAA